MSKVDIKRREFLKKSGQFIVGAVSCGFALSNVMCSKSGKKTDAAQNNPSQPNDASPSPFDYSSLNNIVSISKIKNGDIDSAVQEAIDLLGGVDVVAKGRQRILLKPNLVAESSAFTTKPEVVGTLARLIQKAGKEILIGEGSAGATGFNTFNGEVFRANDPDLLDRMQTYIFDQLGYTDLAKSLGVPLINLHIGDLVGVKLEHGLVFDEIMLQRTLTEIDLLCSVPMMKTHDLAGVSLGMKNLIGCYPGTYYRTARAWVHDQAADAGSTGVAFEIIDMVHANKLGLVVVDGSMAMEGNGPIDGTLVSMNVIIAGMNPLATDMVAAKVMGFEPSEIPTFLCAQSTGMKPKSLSDIEVRGDTIESVQRKFVRPHLYTWDEIRNSWAVNNM